MYHGSSPRVRGTADKVERSWSTFRFIPACAGNGHADQSRLAPRPVHPRVCGERYVVLHVRFSTRGSSPRVRGTVYLIASNGLHLRFIPACAGNGATQHAPQTGGAVHPRVCGERNCSHDGKRPLIGSSPRVRGTGRSSRSSRSAPRFIPACAGNGLSRPNWPAMRTVHPRVCGERHYQQRRRATGRGSSPRVRGTVLSVQSQSTASRFIPACAGNGRLADAQEGVETVHPRVCGERVGVYCQLAQWNGSSPRVRGTAVVVRFHGRVLRFIPACAGNGRVSRSALARASVHPRVCGERMGDAGALSTNAGSSPRVRGTGGSERRH